MFEYVYPGRCSVTNKLVQVISTHGICLGDEVSIYYFALVTFIFHVTVKLVCLVSKYCVLYHNNKVNELVLFNIKKLFRLQSLAR